MYNFILELQHFTFRKSIAFFRDESTDLLHERNTLGHGVSVFRERCIPWIHAEPTEPEATTETTNANQTSSAEPSTFETG